MNNTTDLSLAIGTKIARIIYFFVFLLSALTSFSFILWLIGYHENHRTWIILLVSFGFFFSTLIQVENYVFRCKKDLDEPKA